jgi:hypothetical protein
MSDSSVVKRPLMATVLGILNVVFGGIILLSSLSSLLCVSTLGKWALAFAGVSLFVGTLLSLFRFLLAGALLAAGILLLTDKKAGILMSMIYSIGSFALTVVSIIVYTFGFNAFGYIIELAYPVVLLVLVLQPSVRNFFADKEQNL